MNISNMKEIMGIAHRSQNAIHMIGHAGIGKTEIVKQFAKEQGYHCEVLQLTVMEEGDLMGMPVIETDKYGSKVTTWAKPVWVQRINKANEEGKHCVIFLDELGRASTGIQQASLQMVLEHQIQEHSLGELDGIPSLMVVADNPSDEYDTEEFDGALEDRFITLNVEADIKGWLEYARGKGILPVITDFLAEFHERLVYRPEDTNEKGSTPRAWEALSRIIKETGDSELLYPLIVSKIGKTVGASFFHYYNNYVNVVSVDDIIKTFGNAKMETEKQQRAAAKKMQKVTKDIEVVSASELAEKLLMEYKEKNIKAEVILAYITSLPLEVATGILKTWKLSKDEETKDFYFKGFASVQANRWFSSELIQQAGIIK